MHRSVAEEELALPTSLKWFGCDE
uniref:Uncharacterized protein n=1 Tax=Arundo donax TaxID=35708 RepID=A0A0A8XUB2_ARUDO